MLSIVFFFFLTGKNGLVPDSYFNASTTRQWYYRASQGRLHLGHVFRHGAGSWCAKDNDKHPWLEVQLVKSARVTRVAIQGEPQIHHFVTHYKLDYSMDGKNWITYTENGFERVRKLFKI